MNAIMFTQLILQSECVRTVDAFVSIFANMYSCVFQEIVALSVASFAELTFVWPEKHVNC